METFSMCIRSFSNTKRRGKTQPLILFPFWASLYEGLVHGPEIWDQKISDKSLMSPMLCGSSTLGRSDPSSLTAVCECNQHAMQSPVATIWRPVQQTLCVAPLNLGPREQGWRHRLLVLYLALHGFLLFQLFFF